MDDDRRRVLRALATGAVTTAGLAGCLGANSSGDDGSTDRPTESPTPTPGETPAVAHDTARPGARTAGETDSPATTDDTAGSAATDADGEGRIVLERIDGHPSGTLAVYQPPLRDLLREAATTDSVVSAVVDASVDNPQPVLPAFDAVELVDEAGTASGVYAVSVEAGTHYNMVVKADSVTYYDGEARGLSTLSTERRAFLRKAIRGERVSVFPETERGAWVRDEVFGHAFEHDGTVYRFHEWSATDAAFFSPDAWYRLELTPTDDPVSEPVRLRLDALDDAVREPLHSVVNSSVHRRPRKRITSDPGAATEAVAAFADRTDGLLIHVGALALRIE